MFKILVTGVNGFVGKHLARELAGRNMRVLGIGHHEDEPNGEIASLLDSYYKCDVADKEQVGKLPLKDISAIINLAGLANVGASFDDPELYMKVNVGVLSVLGKALFEANPSARMIAVSTGALYDPNQTMPLNEESHVFTEGSPYALSKLAMEKAAQDLKDKGQDCIVVRPFNHIGPGQGPGFLIPDLAAKLKNTDLGNPQISAGNLKTIRDYTDVRDIARAYANLATAKELNHTLYNVCSGEGHSGEDIIRALCNSFGIDFSKLEIEVDQSLIRPSDPEKIIGSHNRLTADTSWKPQIKLSQTIRDIANQ